MGQGYYKFYPPSPIYVPYIIAVRKEKEKKRKKRQVLYFKLLVPCLFQHCICFCMYRIFMISLADMIIQKQKNAAHRRTVKKPYMAQRGIRDLFLYKMVKQNYRKSHCSSVSLLKAQPSLPKFNDSPVFFEYQRSSQTFPL